jgi:NADPH-dependent stearoyl-CoA 9-desaturase
VTALQHKSEHQAAHLTAEDVARLGRDLDAIRRSVVESRGTRDATYIRRVVKAHHLLEVSGRLLLLVGSRHKAAWAAGTVALATAKSLDNMEIGHNVMHGQWDWMNDPRIHSTTWDWDHVSHPDQWKRAHNVQHHTYTNILGMDNDLGYGIMRVDEDQPWKPRFLVQPVWNLVNALIFEYGIAMYDIDLGEHLREGRGVTPELRARLAQAASKAGRQILKDYVLFPALSGRGWRHTLAATVTAGVMRNVWSHSVIMCGHFPEGVETFEQPALEEEETRAEWYLRQMLGSANISGPPLVHLMSGNLSHQIEHHLFPDLPSNRYAEIAPRVREVFETYGLTYVSRPLPQQVASAWHKVIRLSLPNRWLAETNRANWRVQVRKLLRPGSRGATAGDTAARPVSLPSEERPPLAPPTPVRPGLARLTTSAAH